MFGIVGIKLTRFVAAALAVVLLVVGIVLLAFYFGGLHADLRIATLPKGSMGEKFITAFVAGTHAAHPRINFKTVEVPDLAGAAKAMENGKVDIALIRTDISPPSNGSTLVIVRRDILAIVKPAHSSIDNVTGLTGKAIAIPSGPLQEANSRALDLILNYYNVKPEAVKRVFLPLEQIGAAIHKGEAAAALAVGPIGAGQVADVVTAIAKATRAQPKILEIEDNDAVTTRFPSLESIDIPEGSFKANPALPDDDIKGVAVTYRMVVPVTMFDIVAGALGRSVLNTKARLMQITPLASQIEAPDTSQTNTVLPIHPGFLSYLNNGDQSFFDEFQSYLYLIGIPLSLLGSLIALLTTALNSRKTEARQKKLTRLLMIAEEAQHAEPEQLDRLDDEFRSIVSQCVSELLDGSLGVDQGPVSLAIGHAREQIERRRLKKAA